MAHSDLGQRVENLERLLEVTKLLSVELDLDKMLQTIITQACRALHCDRATIYLHDEASGELVTRFVTELEVSEIRIKVGEGVAGQVAATRELRHVERADQDSSHARHVAKRVGYHVRNMVAAPLVTTLEDKLVGVIQVLNKLGDQPFDKNDEELLSAFASHAAVALNRAQLLIEYKAKQEMEASLAIARDIQTSLFPTKMPAAPGYELAGRSMPCEATGGDYYDAFTLEDGRVALVLGDVSGHGVGPSLLMATARATVHALASEMSDPAELCTRLNTLMCRDLAGGNFITFFYSVLDPATHQLQWCNAGQGPVWRYVAARDEYEVVPATDLPLGIDEELAFSSGDPLVFGPGDMLVLPSDGVPDAFSPQNESFGEPRLRELLQRPDAAACPDKIKLLFETVRHWTAPGVPHDDVSILLARRLP